MNVLVIGKPRYNIILESDSFPLENSKNVTTEKLEIPAGSSIYVACMLAKWGIPVNYIGLFNGDEIGNKIKAELENYGVQTRFIENEYEHKSSINYVLLNKSNGTSTEVLHDNGIFLTKYRYDILPDYIITDGSDMGASIAALNNYPKAKMILLANKYSEEYRDLSKRCAYVCANIDFVSNLTKMPLDFNRGKSLVELFQKVKDLNKAEYIIMLRDMGVLYTKDRQVKMIPAIEVEKKDDANSGSAFFAAYCYGIINGYDIDTIAKTANIAGALALTKVGSLNTIPNKEEVYEIAGAKDNQIDNATEDNNTNIEQVEQLDLDTNQSSQQIIQDNSQVQNTSSEPNLNTLPQDNTNQVPETNLFDNNNQINNMEMPKETNTIEGLSNE